MKSTTNITKAAFAQAKNELNVSIALMFEGQNPYSDKEINNPTQLLELFANHTADFIGDKNSVFNSEWLLKYFTADDLTANGIFTGGDISSHDFDKHDQIFLMGTANHMGGYYRNEYKEIFVFENARLTIDAINSVYLKIDAYDNSNVTACISGSSTLCYYGEGDAKASIDLASHARLDLRIYNRCKAVVEGHDLSSARLYCSDYSRIETDFNDLSMFFLDLLKASVAVLNYTALTNGALSLDKEFTGKYYTGSDCPKLKRF